MSDFLQPTDLDVAVKDFIAETQKEFETLPDEEPQIDVAPSQEVTTEQVNTVPAQTPVTDPAERGLERLVAREVELRERESAFERRMAEVEAMQRRINDLEARALSDETLSQIRVNPREGLGKIGLDADELVRTTLVERLGDKANDPEIKALMEQNRMRREMEALKAQIQQSERQRAAQEYYSRIASGANEFVRNQDGLGKHAPTVAAVAKTAPDRVYSEIMEEITRDAAMRAQREPNGDVITYEEAAKRVEKRWADLKTLFVVPSQAPAAPASMSTPETKQNMAKDNVRTPPSTIKPPEKPLAPWLQRTESEDEALRLAIAEFRRAESQNK